MRTSVLHAAWLTLVLGGCAREQAEHKLGAGQDCPIKGSCFGNASIAPNKIIPGTSGQGLITLPDGAAGWGAVARGDGGSGAPGPTGATGPAGATGAQGPAGATGATGSQGPAGATGANGANGATGATGATGANGGSNIHGDCYATAADGGILCTQASGPVDGGYYAVRQPNVSNLTDAGSGILTRELGPVTTTNATPNTSMAFAVPVGTAGAVDFIISGVTAGDASINAGFSKYTCGIINKAGTCTNYLACVPIQAWSSTDAGSAWATSVSFSGCTATVSVTGATSTTIHWSATMQYGLTHL